MPRISGNTAYDAPQQALEPAEEMALRLKAELEGAEQYAAMQRQELAEYQRHAEREIEVAECMARAARAALHELEGHTDIPPRFSPEEQIKRATSWE